MNLLGRVVAAATVLRGLCPARPAAAPEELLLPPLTGVLTLPRKAVPGVRPPALPNTASVKGAGQESHKKSMMSAHLC